MARADALPAEIQARYHEELEHLDRIRGASIYPAVQNIVVACGALGLGTVITTNHTSCEGGQICAWFPPTSRHSR